MVLGLYKLFVDFEGCAHEPIIYSFPAPTCIAYPGAILLHDFWAVYDPPLWGEPDIGAAGGVRWPLQDRVSLTVYNTKGASTHAQGTDPRVALGA